ncbi:MAG: HAD family hydrolase [Pseudobdellovibrionaceae bacterium]
MIQAIAFDFGGTLFSTAKMGKFTPAMTNVFIKAIIQELKCSTVNAEFVFSAYIKAWKQRRARAGNLPEHEVSSFDLLKYALTEVGFSLNKDQIIKILNAFHAEESNQFSPLPFVIESLPLLLKDSYRLCIVSNNPWSESIKASLQRHNIGTFFEHIIVSCDIGFRKPHQQIFEELIKRLALPASNILFVGDSFIHDTEKPKQLGMKTCLVDFECLNKNDQKKHENEADLFLTRFDQLPHAIKTLTFVK